MAFNPYNFKKASEAIAFISRLRHTKGRWAGEPFNLLPWQIDLIQKLFGTVREDGTRQYRWCYCEVPKKNGKSELAAAIGLKLLFADHEPGAEVYCAAADRDQASIVFNVAAQMVRRAKPLYERSKIIDSQKRIVVPGTASFMRALSAEAYTKHGFNSSGVIFDELHAQPNRELWDVLTLGSGDARTQPLVFAITTAGFDRHSICYEQHQYAQKVLRGIIEDPTYLPIIYGAPEDANWEDEKIWIEANPALGQILDIENIRDQYRKSKENPAMQNMFRRLRLNQWVSQSVRFIDMGAWDACNARFDLNRLRGRTCFAGLDLSSTTDITALVLVFPPEIIGGIYEILCYFWVPEENMKERIKKDRVPYDVWVQQGFIEATPGNLIDYNYIVHRLNELSTMFDIKEIGFDRWGATQLMVDLEEEGWTVIPVGQGYSSMSPPTKELLNKVLGQKLRHAGNPVLRWMADNLVVRQDPAGNLKPDKEKSTERIDGMVALVMGLDRAVRNTEGANIYETEDILFMG